MKKLIVYPLISVCLFSLASCSAILGIHKIKHKTDQQIITSAKKLGIPEGDLYALDTTFEKAFKLDTAKFKMQMKNHYQPLQALYFDGNGALTQFYINCYAGGGLSLNWNRNGILNSFPPKDQAPVDTVLDLNKQLSYITGVGSSSIDAVRSDKSDYKVVVYWNMWMFKHSKKLINEIKSNCSYINGGKTVKIIYVNNDNWWEHLEKKQKK